MATDVLDAVAVSHLVRDTYLRYLRTLIPIREPALADAVYTALAEESALVSGPYLEATPPYRAGASVGQLIDEGVLSPWLRRLDHEDGLPLDRPLYRHQEMATRKAVSGRNLVVATGTGSGKTEGFLLPILQHLAEEADAGSLTEPGVRALLLYPMNALANDQLKRLRGVLRKFPEVTFGRYTGETRQTKDDAKLQFTTRYPGMAQLSNELLSRNEMQAAPPHLLLTNYAMLEFLLLRPADHALFDGPSGEHWKFVVLDEAHVYDGASGIEVAMLLRRLRDRVSRDRPLQYIATSATVGGSDAGPQVASFASTLFAGDFEYGQDPSQQDVVWAEREPIGTDRTWGPLPTDAYAELAMAEDLTKQLSRHTKVGDQIPADVLAQEERIRRLQQLLQAGPRTLFSVAWDLFPDREERLQLTGDVVALAAGMRRDNGAPLLPARYHLWARATEGAFVCLSADGPHARLTRHEFCPECRAKVFELGSCKRCSATYLMGVSRKEGTNEFFGPPNKVGETLTWLVLPARSMDQPGRTTRIDEDDATLEGIEELPDHAGRWLCVVCGRLHDSGAACDCGGSLRPVVQVDQMAVALQTCGLCGGRSNAGQIRRLESGADASVAVLATAVYQSLPPDTDESLLDRPGQGRKLLLFADSRQDAAYFAPYLEDTYSDLVRRRIVFDAIAAVDDPEDPPRLDDVALRAAKVADKFGVFDWKATRASRLQRTRTWLHAELLSLTDRSDLEGLGLVAFDLLRPPRLAMPEPLLDLGLSDDEAWSLITELLRNVRSQGAVSFPEDVLSNDELFEPRTGPIYLRGQGPESRRKVLSWLPGRGENTRSDYLRRLIRQLGREADALVLLQGMWRWLTEGAARELLMHINDSVRGPVAQLNHELITVGLVDADRPVFRCTTCRRMAPQSIRGVCLTMGCDGQLVLWVPPSPEMDDNHYRVLARELNAVPLTVSEHTAQFTSDAAANIQQQFLDGYINALSCSTTFELGVDVGELQSVVLRNVPPTTSNYVQRAGRAGRRTDAAALVVTYAQGRSHDLTYFRNPVRMIAGEVRPPRVTVRNDRIARRHAHAVVLAKFFRWIVNGGGPELRTADDLFGDARIDLQLVDWLRAPPDDVVPAIRHAIPEDLHRAIGLHNGAWAERLSELIQDISAQHQHDVQLYREMEEQASAERNYTLAGVYSRVINTFEKRYLLSELSSKNVLPKYGFPVDTVELRTSHIGHPSAARLELDRDLRLAISDYAPGGQVVAGGFLWESGGLYRFPNRDFPRWHYATCTCGWYEEGLEPLDVDKCPICHRSGVRAPRPRQYIIPEFGFVAKKTQPTRPRRRPRRSYTGAVHLIESSLESDPELIELESGGALAHTYAEGGELAVINAGTYHQGFRVCGWCGAGEPASPGQASKSQHSHPLTGRPCNGYWEWVDLGQRFQTDVLRLQFTAASILPSTDVWWGLLYAILEAGSDRLGIARDDVGGTLHFGGQGAPTLVLYDDVPAGAGHVRAIREELYAILEDARDRVHSCECGPETSCYRCLRNFRNQRMHDRLRRGAVADLLDDLLGERGAFGEAGPDDAAFEDLRTDDLVSVDGRYVKLELDGRPMIGRIWVEADGDQPERVLVESDGRTIEARPDQVNLIGVRRL